MRPFHPAYILEVLPQLLPYLWVTAAITAETVLFGGLAGLFLAAAQLQKKAIFRLLAKLYLYITRCVPSIVMLFLVYYGLPKLLLSIGINVNAFGKGFFVVTTFSMLFAASMSEVFRSAYEAVDKGQREAAVSIGMTQLQAFRRVVLPQCTAVALPNFTNALVNLMKEGALAYTIGLIDIMGKGQLMIGMNQGSYSLEIYLALAFLYWLMTLFVEQVFRKLEKRLLKGQKALTSVH